MKLTFDIHIHTNYSYDGFIKIGRLAKYAKKLGLNGIAITDHNTFDSIKWIQKFNLDNTLEIIPGEEVLTNWGDILCLCIKEPIKSKNIFDVVKEVKEQKGITILPHPFKNHDKAIFDNLEIIDGVEICNGRTKDYYERIKKITYKYPHLIEVGGSDAHFLWEIGKVVTTIEIPDNRKGIKFYEAIREFKPEIEKLNKKLPFIYPIFNIGSKIKKKTWGKHVANRR